MSANAYYNAHSIIIRYIVCVCVCVYRYKRFVNKYLNGRASIFVFHFPDSLNLQ